ncbi:ABC transporter permease [Ethanoligenens harbinense]|uniref:ABC transporter permease n=1 Tax=Ethanoligenens harbinense TaxID=253239 RepID=UPI0013C474EC|nr:ABC transporter permease [Ethanoligenens harbinense]
MGKSGSPLSLTDSGVIITQQLAKNLGLKQGDTLTVQDDDTHSHRFRVSGIAENYLMNDVFITPAAYQDAYGSAADVNQLLVNLKAGASQNTISENAMKMDGVASVSLLSDLKQTFSDTVKSLNGMVAIVIFSALLLAAVVLFTLTSINIAERFREIATIKVLGFYDREVSGYVTRESYILTLIGIALGCAGGIVLHARILDAISVNNVMFVRSILPQSFLISAALTLVFTWLINLLAMRAMQKIDMVEALKGTE